VTPSGIDPGTFRLVAQCLNHYATPGPQNIIWEDNITIDFMEVLHQTEGREYDHVSVRSLCYISDVLTVLICYQVTDKESIKSMFPPPFKDRY
jgi:hypothetical protein